jgi:hypothetical protein
MPDISLIAPAAKDNSFWAYNHLLRSMVLHRLPEPRRQTRESTSQRDPLQIERTVELAGVLQDLESIDYFASTPDDCFVMITLGLDDGVQLMFVNSDGSLRWRSAQDTETLGVVETSGESYDILIMCPNGSFKRLSSQTGELISYLNLEEKRPNSSVLGMNYYKEAKQLVVMKNYGMCVYTLEGKLVHVIPDVLFDNICIRADGCFSAYDTEPYYRPFESSNLYPFYDEHEWGVRPK